MGPCAWPQPQASPPRQRERHRQPDRQQPAAEAEPAVAAEDDDPEAVEDGDVLAFLVVDAVAAPTAPPEHRLLQRLDDEEYTFLDAMYGNAPGYSETNIALNDFYPEASENEKENYENNKYPK